MRGKEQVGQLAPDEESLRALLRTRSSKLPPSCSCARVGKGRGASPVGVCWWLSGLVPAGPRV